jgi:hypothetical protein
MWWRITMGFIVGRDGESFGKVVAFCRFWLAQKKFELHMAYPSYRTQ